VLKSESSNIEWKVFKIVQWKSQTIKMVAISTFVIVVLMTFLVLLICVLKLLQLWKRCFPAKNIPMVSFLLFFRFTHYYCLVKCVKLTLFSDIFNLTRSNFRLHDWIQSRHNHWGSFPSFHPSHVIDKALDHESTM
jgi:hypothetical protein